MTNSITIPDINPLRIAMLSIHSSPIGPLGTQNTGGMSVYVRETAKWIAAYGHAVDIFTYTPGDTELIDLYPNVRLIHLNPNIRKDICKQELFDHLPAAALALERFAQSQGLTYHMIHSHYWLSGIVGTKLKKRWGCPHLTMFHTLGRIKNTTTAGESEPERRIDHERRLVGEADSIVVPADAERENLIRHYDARPEKVTVIPCGVNMDRFKPMEKNKARQQLKIDVASGVVLFVGRFAPVKGLDMLLNAVAELVPRYPPLKLVVVGGDGPYADTTAALKKRAEKLALSSHLYLAGRIDHNDLPLFYNAADLLALPSSYESFGLVTLESLACGTPVAATVTGGAAAIIREGLNGTLVERPESVCFSQGMERLLIQVRQQELSPEQIRRSVTGYGWDRIAASIMLIYDALLSQAKTMPSG